MTIILEPVEAGKTGGTLYVVATPIGHLSDLSERARHVLLQVRWVAAEDTRVTKVLLQSVGSNAKTLAVHQHNEAEAARRIIEILADGQDIALVSDAGTPAISDPGALVVQAAREAGHTIVPIPGPNAITTLLSASGLAAGGFFFDGFLPAKPKARQERVVALLQAQLSLGMNVVVYEAPHRIHALAEVLDQHLASDQLVVIGRELTKKFEQIEVLPAGQVGAWVKANNNHERGEFVIAWSPPAAGASAQPEALDRDAVVPLPLGQLIDVVGEHLPASRAAKLLAQLTGLPRAVIYQAISGSAEPE